MTVAAGLLPLHFLARRYSCLATSVAEIVKKPITVASAAMVTGVYKGGVGEWEEIQPELENALDVFETLGDLQQWSECLSILAINHLLQGSHDKCRAMYERLIEGAIERNNALQHAWGLEWAAAVAYREGRLQETVELTTEALVLLSESQDLSAQFDLYGLKALALVRLGQLEAALKTGEAAEVIIGQSTPNLYSMFIGYSGMIEVYLALYGDAKKAKKPELEMDFWIKKARQVSKDLQRFRQFFPIGSACAFYYQGRYELALGERRRAYSAFQKSLEVAVMYGMPYEQAQAYYGLGSSLPQGDPKRNKNLARAAKIFSELGAKFDLEIVKKTLGDE
jgi:tetratricopeptide (TPR) repeat protein